MTNPDPWETCDECRTAGMTHTTREELEADPVGTWRQHWRADSVAVRWYDHPCDAQPGATPDQPEWPKAWAMFGPWGVDEVPHFNMQESHRIDTATALEHLARQTTPVQEEQDTDSDADAAY